MSELLLDTHTFLWWVLGDERLPERMRSRIPAAERVWVSAASAWEIRTKYRLGKLPEASPTLAVGLSAVAASHGFRELGITFNDGDLAGSFAQDHKDPFDRMLAAQSINHRLALVSNDTALDAFGVVRVW
ncbi:MAG TPA: type II toxin-antitoxin system VapC family toxin [Gemmatirosa sp.]